MRYWSLLFSTLCASIVSVLSLVLPFCLFLNVYHGDLFVAASERSAQRGIEVMLYLAPILTFFAWICFYCIFRLSSVPIKFFEFKKFLKLLYRLGLVWFSLIFFFQFLDGRMADILESLVFGSVTLFIATIPLSIGILAGNYCYLKLMKKIKIDFAKNVRRTTYKPL